MLAIHVEFVHDTFRATPADDLALTGAETIAEWPPSPARLYSALVAAAGTGEFARSIHDDSDLVTIESSPPPTILAVSQEDAPSSALVERYAVVDEKKDNSVQNYVARASQVVRPGARRAPVRRDVVFVWDSIDPAPSMLDALRFRAARIGYLGCSDSPARVRVHVSIDQLPTEELTRWVPAAEGEVDLPVAYPGFLSHLDDAFARWRSKEPMRRSWIPNRIVPYIDSARLQPEPRIQPHCIWLQLDRPVRARMIVRFTDALRSAVLGRYQELFFTSPDDVPQVLHGHHDGQTSGYDHVSWLALPYVGSEFADGRIRGACITLPPETPLEVVEGIRVAVGGEPINLHDGDFFQTNASPHDGSATPLTSNPKRWTRSARVFTTAFPAVHERFSKAGLSHSEVSRWCINAGLPEPISVRWSKLPFTKGGAVLNGRDTARKGERVKPFSHVRIEFAESIRGPVVIGRGRHFGLGLMVPIASATAAREENP